MHAVKTVAQGKAVVKADVPLPPLYPGTVLVAVKCVAINPTDWKYLHNESLAKPGHTLGCDFAGVVVALGPNIISGLREGDRVGGFAHGSRDTDSTDGCFADYTRCTEQSVFKLPDSFSFEQGATLGIAIATQGQSLYQTLKLPLPDSAEAKSNHSTPLLIYGGSSSMGLSAIQYAKLSGCSPIITTCSPRNFDLVKARGADFVADYRNPDVCIGQIRDFIGDKLEIAYDCISEGESWRICAESLTQKPGVGRYTGLLPPKLPRDDLALATSRLGYTVHGDNFNYGPTKYQASEEDVAFARMFYPLSGKLLAAGKLTETPFQAQSGGLMGVIDGMEALRKGQVSGSKLVFPVPG